MNKNNTEPSEKQMDEGYARNTMRALRTGENPVHVAAAAAGFVIATGVALASGQSATSDVTVAWASPLYFVFAVMALVCPGGSSHEFIINHMYDDNNKFISKWIFDY